MRKVYSENKTNGYRIEIGEPHEYIRVFKGDESRGSFPYELFQRAAADLAAQWLKGKVDRFMADLGFPR